MENLKIVGFLWCIKDFSKLPDTEIFSQCFWSGGHSWRLSIYPKGIKEKSEEHLSVFLEAVPATNFKDAIWKTDTYSVTFFLRENHESTVDIICRASKTSQEFTSNNPSWGFLRFFELEKLYSMIKNDQFVVGVTIRKINNNNSSLSSSNSSHSISSSPINNLKLSDLEYNKYLCSPPTSPIMSSKPKFNGNSSFYITSNHNLKNETENKRNTSSSLIELPPSVENEIYLIQIGNEIKIFCPYIDRMMKVSKEFESEFNNENTADVQLIIENKCIYAHKLILSARSNYFKAMFNSGMCESEYSKIKITDFSYSIIESLIKFLYSGRTVINDDLNDLIELYKAADKYQLETLMAYIHQTICSKITCKNVCSILSEIYCFPLLEKSCLEFIAENLGTLYYTPDFRNLLSGGYEETLTTLFGILALTPNND